MTKIKAVQRKRGGSAAAGMVLFAYLYAPALNLSYAQTGAPTGRQITTAALEIDARARRLYATDADGNRLLLLDLKTGQQLSIAVGKRPIGVALDSAAHRGYVVNAGSGTVSVVDLDVKRVVATVRTDLHPFAIAVDSRLHRAYVSNVFSNQVTMIDGATFQPTALAIGSQDTVLVEPQLHKVWLCSYENDHLSLLDEADSSIRSVPAVNHLWALAHGSAPGEIFAVSIGSDELVHVRLGSALERTKVGSMPDALAVDAHRGRVYVANYADGSVTVLDTATLHTVTTVPVGHTPQSIVIDSARHRLYVANTHDGTVSVLDTQANRVIKTLPTVGLPYLLKLDTKSGDVFAATLGDVPFHKIPIGGR